MTHRLTAYPERCIGCRMCTMACSLTKTGRIGPGDARIFVAHFGEQSRYVPVICMQCADAPCMNACPTFAIRRDAATGAMHVEADLCVGCRMCTAACPFGVMGFDAHKGKAVKCDECGGQPECVRFCPVDAITWEAPATQLHERRQHTALTLASGVVGQATP